jgi:hypothetical protein
MKENSLTLLKPYLHPLSLGGGASWWAKIGDFGANMYNQADETVTHYLNNLLEHQNFKSTCQYFSTQGTRIVMAHHQFLRRDFIIKMSNKTVFNSSIAKILIIVLFLKIMLFMDFNNFCIPHFFLTSF